MKIEIDFYNFADKKPEGLTHILVYSKDLGTGMIDRIDRCRVVHPFVETPHKFSRDYYRYVWNNLEQDFRSGTFWSEDKKHED